MSMEYIIEIYIKPICCGANPLGKLFQKISVECSCCSVWRGFILGIIVSSIFWVMI